uniref:Uncharacterized protein n=1 Tax=Vitis vinifera TaxID=29760 RepID=F6H3A5_VITVI
MQHHEKLEGRPNMTMGEVRKGMAIYLYGTLRKKKI